MTDKNQKEAQIEENTGAKAEVLDLQTLDEVDGGKAAEAMGSTVSLAACA